MVASFALTLSGSGEGLGLCVGVAGPVAVVGGWGVFVCILVQHLDCEVC